MSAVAVENTRNAIGKQQPLPQLRRAAPCDRWRCFKTKSCQDAAFVAQCTTPSARDGCVKLIARHMGAAPLRIGRWPSTCPRLHRQEQQLWRAFACGRAHGGDAPLENAKSRVQ